MKIALVSNYYNEKHLQEVTEEMKTLGAPKIHAVWMECYDHWVALEGCHRLRAAQQLGLTPEIIEVEYSDEMASSVPGYDGEEDYMISELCDISYKATVLKFEEE